MIHWIAVHWFGIGLIAFLLFFLYLLITPWGDDPMGGP